MVELTPSELKRVQAAKQLAFEMENSIRLKWWQNLLRLLFRPFLSFGWILLFLIYYFIRSAYFLRYVLLFVLFLFSASQIKGDIFILPLFIFGGK